jgi:hypothetical protein
MPYYNVLQAKTAVASASSSYSNYTPDKAIDNKGQDYKNYATSRWISGSSAAGEWLQVDIGAVARVNKFILYSGNADAEGTNLNNAIINADFQIWQNDSWVTVGSFRNNPLTNGKNEVKLDKFYKTDKVRVYFPITEQQYRIFELEAYGRILGKKAKGTASKNLLPPFTSALWNFTRPIVSISPSKLVLDLDQSRTNEVIVPAKPNTTYTLSGKTDGRVYFVQRLAGNLDKTGTGYSNYGTFSRTITTGSDVVGLRISMTTDDAGNKSYENIMLNEGQIALPYQVNEQNMRQARLIGKKNLIPPFTDKAWSLIPNADVVDGTKLITHGSGNWDVSKVLVPVEVGKPYTLSAKVTGTGSVEIWEDSTLNLGSFAKDVNIAGGFASRTYTPTKSPAEIRIVNSKKELTDLVFEDLQLEKAESKTPYEKYHGTNKPAKKAAQKNLIDPKMITLRAGTNNVTIKGNRIEFDALGQDYAGINFQVNNDLDYAGKTITWSCTNRSAGVTPMLAYKPVGSESLTYIGADLTTNSRTMLIPAGATNVRFYVQNNAGQRGNFFIEGWQVEYGEKTPYSPYKYGNKLSIFQEPKKNYLLPFTSWGAEAAAGMTYDVFTDRKVIINYNSTSQYVGLQMPVDYKTLYQLRGKTVTFSAKAIDRYAMSTTQVQMRFWGGSAGNLDFVLSNTQLSSTKVVPPDFTGFFIKIQTNVIGTAKIMVEDLQLEIGDTRTDFALYSLGTKKAKY